MVRFIVYVAIGISIMFLYQYLFPTVTGWKLFVSSFLINIILFMLIDLIWPRQKYSDEMDTE